MNIITHKRPAGAATDPRGEAVPPSERPAPPPPPPPQPFEIALVRKLESKTSSVRDAFLLLDADGDGRVGPSDVRTVLHNELGLDLSAEQEACLFARSRWGGQRGGGEEDRNDAEAEGGTGMGYGDFARYFQAVSGATLPASQAGLAAAVGFQRDEAVGRNSSERAIRVQPQTVLRQRRRQVQQLLMAHSSRTTGSAMKETSLFLKMDVHRSGRVTMREFLDWLNAAGGLLWTMEDLRQVVLGEIDGNGNVVLQEDKLAKRWFRGPENGEGETGMLQHEFAEFVESLDVQ